jgi:hypothetical protein
MADRTSFYVPAETVPEAATIRARVTPRDHLVLTSDDARLLGAIAVDGSLMVVPAREGIPSVRYGYAQGAAAWLDLEMLEAQKHERFVDPVALDRAVNSALVSFDFPVSGAYLRQGLSLRDSWRECIDDLFRTRRIEVNRLNQRLLDLLFLLHGEPGVPAATLTVSCPAIGCAAKDLAVPPAGMACPACQSAVYPTDCLRIYEEVVDDGSNEEPLGRLMQVIELLITVGLATLLWTQSRNDLLMRTLFVTDGPLAVYGPPAKLRGRALDYFQKMASSTPGPAPFLCGVEKSGLAVDFAGALSKHDILEPGDLLTLDATVLSQIVNSQNVEAYGSETYWGRKFIYRALDGRVVVLTVIPDSGSPYDDHGGQPEPGAYSSLPFVLDVVDRTGSSMYRNGIIPVALAHSKAAYPIGVGTDVLRLAARRKLGLDAEVDTG